MQMPFRRLRLAATGLALLCLGGCAHEAPVPSNEARTSSCPSGAEVDADVSTDVLCREPVANKVKVRHVLVGWKELASPGHPVDPRAFERTYAQALEIARGVLKKLQAGAPIEPLMQEVSEDPGSAQSGQAYDVSPDAALVSGFKSLSLRLQLGEAAIVKTAFGFHVIQRVQ
jgi:peptidyl-prolyl cis-trans isomerase D